MLYRHRVGKLKLVRAVCKLSSAGEVNRSAAMDKLGFVRSQLQVGLGNGHSLQEATVKAKAFKARHHVEVQASGGLESMVIPEDWADARYAYNNKQTGGKKVPFYYGYYSSKWGNSQGSLSSPR